MATTEYLTSFPEPIPATLDPACSYRPRWVIGELQALAKRTRRDDIVFSFVLAGIQIHVNRRSDPRLLEAKFEGMVLAGSTADAVCGP